MKGIVDLEALGLREYVYVEPISLELREIKGLRGVAVALVSDGRIDIGVAFQSPSDVFSRKTGIQIARGRAIAAYHQTNSPSHTRTVYLTVVDKLEAYVECQAFLRREREQIITNKHRLWLDRVTELVWKEKCRRGYDELPYGIIRQRVGLLFKQD